MSFSSVFEQVGTLRACLQRHVVVFGCLCGSDVGGLSVRLEVAVSGGVAMREPGVGGGDGSSDGRALITSGRCSGWVPRSASQSKTMLRASRATGAIARANTVAVASAASARLGLVMTAMGALCRTAGPLPHVQADWT